MAINELVNALTSDDGKNASIISPNAIRTCPATVSVTSLSGDPGKEKPLPAGHEAVVVKTVSYVFLDFLLPFPTVELKGILERSRNDQTMLPFRCVEKAEVNRNRSSRLNGFDSYHGFQLRRDDIMINLKQIVV
ncbi:hypothetical protein ZHAS_00006917 [Anopheles sinensis]|uniref:Uncharacterized protein n=1 Tax=Anopheles sinensis TaxID=74873 RepID=A0A084VN85_ANOSI|nr:hypothetical protein ZHAS_00006917 [Anopheles sinensis]